ncbi:EAL domain-containing protein [Acidiferrobacter sp.]|jgi:diguanylate cyclase (GGDEF)-like protein/PAS domain S-box-containing protein|uniref:EAL domain-containing protein n=1 Tax=Acidiferrobacter sp. TaxID=1872107 RepID=UPI002622D40F|nr:EAL domain-containing protein [Acidiferrobacter sp.]
MAAPVRILLLEDAEDDEALVRRTLAKAGLTFALDRVASRTAMIQALDANRYDIILSDYSMPGLSPFDVLAVLAERRLDIPVILVTGTIGENRAAAIMRAGAHDFILKEDMSRLVPAIERELREAQGRYQRCIIENDRRKLASVVEQTADAVMVTDRNGHIEYVNPAVSEQTGYSASELLGATPAMFRSGAHDRAFYQKLWSTLLSGREFRAIFTNRRKNGERYFEAKTLTPLKDEAGIITGFISTGRDVSELVRMREDLERSLSVLRATLEATADAIVVTDLQQSIVDFNRQYCDLWGSSDLPTRPWNERKAMIAGLLSDPEELFEAVRWLYEHPDEIRSQAVTLQDGRTLEYYSQPQRRGEEIIGRVWCFRDITERVRHEQRLAHLAYHDPLTDLPNRWLLEEQLKDRLADMRAKSACLAVVVIAIDRFNRINETLGHGAGDEILQIIARRLMAGIADGGLLARTGGSKFVIVQGVGGVGGAGDLAAALRATIAEPTIARGKELFLTASVGIGLYPEDATDPYTLLQQADSAAARASEDGGDVVARYRSHMSADATQRLATEHALHRALAQQEFVLHYQPQVCLRTGRILGVEALIRWQDPQVGLVPPSRFIPVAEETGLIVPITEWALVTACTQAADWRRADVSDITMAVNISARLFNHGDLLGVADRALVAAGLEPRFLEVEITEGVIMRDLEHTIDLLRELRRRGVRASVDDFGTGYCALGYLRDFPLDVLKIDRSFVQRLGADPRDEAVTATIIQIAHTFALHVVAEGAETASQVRKLVAMNCDALQGYYFSRPVSAEECGRLLRNPRPFADQESEGWR